MRISTKVLASAALALGFAFAFPHMPVISLDSGEAQAAVSISIGGFYDRLARYGDWVRRGRDYVFVPNVGPGWRPYTFGHWEYTDRFGWMWISDEPFGWATYHYGRWGFDPDLGWYWVPATEWAPAWVSWRRSNDYVGWAPLPPDRDTGLEAEIDIDSDRYADRYWAIVPAPEFLSGNVGRVVIREKDTRFNRVFRETKPLGRVKVVNKVVMNNLINVDEVERLTRKKVRVKKVREVNEVDQAGKAAADDSVAVFAPSVEKTTSDKPRDVKSTEDVTRKRKKESGDATKKGAEEQPTGKVTTQETDEAGSSPKDQTKKAKKKRANKAGEQPGEEATSPQTDGQEMPAKKAKRTKQQQNIGTQDEGTGQVPPKKKQRELQQDQQSAGETLKPNRKQKSMDQPQESQPGTAPSDQGQNKKKKNKKCDPGTENCPG